MVDGQDVDRDSVVGDGETCSAVWRVPSWDTVGGGEEGEFGERAEGGVLGGETIRAIGTGNSVGRLAGVVVGSIIPDRSGECGRDEESDSGKSEAELHVDERMRALEVVQKVL